MQSHDYVPGVSGWKLAQGEIEINSATFTVGGLPSEPRLITITAGEWPDSELPANAIERYRFIGEQVQKIPAKWVASAEFTSEDFSFDRDGSDYRTTLTYTRPETAEEAAARVEKSKQPGARAHLVDGVLTITSNGIPRVRIGNLEKPDAPKPFIIVDGVTYIREGFIEDATVTSAKIDTNWSVKMQLTADGRYVAAGIGQGLDSQFPVNAERFAIQEPTEFEQAMAKGGEAVLELLVRGVSDTALGHELASPITDQLRDVLRAELRPGGLLHRR